MCRLVEDDYAEVDEDFNLDIICIGMTLHFSYCPKASISRHINIMQWFMTSCFNCCSKFQILCFYHFYFLHFVFHILVFICNIVVRVLVLVSREPWLIMVHYFLNYDISFCVLNVKECGCCAALSYILLVLD